MFNSLESKYKNLIAIDAGDLLFKVPNPSPAAREQAERKMTLLINAYNEFNYNALNVGMNDLALGVDFLKKYESQANFPFISANIIDSTGSLVFQPFVTINQNNSKIGVVGVTTGNTLAETVAFKNVLRSANDVESKIRGDVDYLILLASVDGPAAKQLEENAKGYDLIVRSHTNYLSRTPNQSPDGYYLQTGSQGKYMLVVNVHWDRSVEGRPADVTRELQQLQLTEERLARMREDAGDQSLEEAYADSKATLNFIHRMQDQRQKLNAQLDSTKSYIAYEMHLLGNNYQSNEKWEQKVQEFVQQTSQQ